MPKRIAILVLLSAAAAPAFSQVATPSVVTRIDAATQRQRDQTRAAILQDELVSEALALGMAQREARSDSNREDPRASREVSERIARHRQNISALAKELANVDRLATPAKPQALQMPVVDAADAGLPSARAVARPRANDDGRARLGGAPDWVIPAVPPGRVP